MISFSFGKISTHKTTKDEEKELVNSLKIHFKIMFKGEIFKTMNMRDSDINGVIESSKSGFYAYGACFYLYLYDQDFNFVKEKNCEEEVFSILEDEREGLLFVGTSKVLILDLELWYLKNEAINTSTSIYIATIVKLLSGNYAVGRSDFKINIINKIGEIQHTITTHTGNITKIIEKGPYLISTAFDGCLVYSDINNFEFKNQYKINSNQNVFDLILLSDGKILSSSNDIVISDGGEIYSSLKFQNDVYSVVETRDHQLICISRTKLHIVKEVNNELIIEKSVELNGKAWKVNLLWNSIIAVSFFQEGRIVFLK